MTLDLKDSTQEDLDSVVRRAGVDLASAIRDVQPIIDAVRAKGDSALRRFAAKYDGFRGGSLTLPASRLRSARKRVTRELLAALLLSRKRIDVFHSRQVLKSFEFFDDCGYYGQKVVPLDRVGVYVPGGTADYMSTVLMACVPARIAGVREIALFTPGRGGSVPDGILAAADICAVREVHPIGGAHSIAAMAYGTQSIRKVQKIIGPGGAYIAAAKMMVRNDCEIDFLAGPSEILILAGAKATPESLASDMLAQLEHDPFARAVLVATSRSLIERTRTQLESMLESAERSDIARRSARRGAIFVCAPTMKRAVDFANEYAPEHLLIDAVDQRTILNKVHNAGSVFLGSYSSVAFGDYCSGTNHILPTKGTAAMKSSLTVYDFLKIIPYQSISESGASELAPTVSLIARAEGLPAHAEAATRRAGWKRR